METQALVTLLLVGRFLSLIFISFVIKRQLGLFKHPITAELVNFRRVLFFLSVVVFLAQLIPIAIDSLTLLTDLRGREVSIHPYGIAYMVSNNFSQLLSAILIWTLYRMAAMSHIVKRPRTARTRKDD